MRMKKEAIRKKWCTPVIIKLNISRTSAPGKKHPKVEFHNGSHDATAYGS